MQSGNRVSAIACRLPGVLAAGVIVGGSYSQAAQSAHCRSTNAHVRVSAGVASGTQRQVAQELAQCYHCDDSLPTHDCMHHEAFGVIRATRGIVDAFSGCQRPNQLVANTCAQRASLSARIKMITRHPRYPRKPQARRPDSFSPWSQHTGCRNTQTLAAQWRAQAQLAL